MPVTMTECPGFPQRLYGTCSCSFSAQAHAVDPALAPDLDLNPALAPEPPSSKLVSKET